MFFLQRYTGLLHIVKYLILIHPLWSVWPAVIIFYFCIMNNAHPVILFDGVCNLCNASVQFVIKGDPGAKFRFSSLQSDTAKQMLQQAGLDHTMTDTVVLFYNGKVYTQSDAALHIARRLTGLWPVMHVLIVIPRPIRNAVYNWIARNRYRWFGKKDQCMIPSPELKHRFLN